MKLIGGYKDLVFTRQQLVMSDAEYIAIASEFWSSNTISPQELTDRDRAFLQAALLIAVDKSEKAGMLFDLWSSFVKAAPSQSLKKLVKGFAKKVANRWFKAYLDDTPKISAVGKAAVQYSAFTTEWRMRVAIGDPDMLTNFLVR